MSVVGFDINNVVVVEEGDLVGGWIEWHNVPPGIHEISAVTVSYTHLTLPTKRIV